MGTIWRFYIYILLKPSHFIFNQKQFRINQDLFRNQHVYLHLENYCAYANQKYVKPAVKVDQIVQNCIIKYKVGLTKHQNVLSVTIHITSNILQHSLRQMGKWPLNTIMNCNRMSLQNILNTEKCLMQQASFA